MASFEELTRDFLTKCKEEFDEVTTRESSIEESDNEMSLLIPDHIQFAKYGRGPGVGPPLENVIDFIEAKNIIFEDQTLEGTAFLIQRSIATKGTSNWVENAPDFIEEVFEKYQKDYLSIVNVTIAKDIAKSYKEELKEFWEEEDRLLKEFKI